jgi:glycosyltransferase involved in cell wall biosynthesis
MEQLIAASPGAPGLEGGRIIPRVLIVGNFLSATRGFSRGVCEDLAVRLQEYGHVVLTTSHRRSRLNRLVDMLRTVWKQHPHFDVAQVDVFSGPAFIWAEAVCGLLKLLRKPFVLTLHGGNLPVFADRWPRRVARLLSSATCVTAPSRFLQETLRVYRRDIELIPNGMDLSAYTFRKRSSVAPRLVWLRAFHSIYNPTLLPAVVAKLAKHHPETFLTMIGPDKGDGSLESTRRIAEKLGVNSRIRFIPGIPKEEVPTSLDGQEIFISLSDADNTPVSIVEAMASGLPVVSSDVGGMRYLVEDREDGLLVPSRDPDAVATAVEELLAQPLLVQKLTSKAREKAEAFDWAIVLPRWQQIFERVAASGKHGAD